MAYEIFLLPVPHGADVEEAGEALLARLEGATEVPADTQSDAALAAVVGAVRAGDRAIGPAPVHEHPAPGGSLVPVVALRGAHGIDVAVARGFARFRVPFHHRGEDADLVFDRLFRLLAAVAAATGWLAYDPQEAEQVPVDDVGRDATLEIYLTVMDQLRPDGAGSGRARPSA